MPLFRCLCMATIVVIISQDVQCDGRSPLERRVGNIKYICSPNKQNSTGAFQYCRKLGGRLLSLINDKDSSIVDWCRSDVKNSFVYYFIGLDWAEKDQTWRWSRNRMPLQHWENKPNMPSFDCPSCDKCIIAKLPTNRWYHVSCESAEVHQVICEVDIAQIQSDHVTTATTSSPALFTSHEASAASVTPSSVHSITNDSVGENVREELLGPGDQQRRAEERNERTITDQEGLKRLGVQQGHMEERNERTVTVDTRPTSSHAPALLDMPTALAFGTLAGIMFTMLLVCPFVVCFLCKKRQCAKQSCFGSRSYCQPIPRCDVDAHPHGRGQSAHEYSELNIPDSSRDATALLRPHGMVDASRSPSHMSTNTYEEIDLHLAAAEREFMAERQDCYLWAGPTDEASCWMRI